MPAWLVDGNNVMGARPDGWWRDRDAARRRLVAALDDLAAATGDPVTVVFDGRERDVPAARAVVRFAPHADDLLAQLAGPRVTLVTSDRELRGRAQARGAAVTGARAFRERLGV
jgi:predicted RNA-binding protein with PIN domain